MIFTWLGFEIVFTAYRHFKVNHYSINHFSLFRFGYLSLFLADYN